MNQRGMLEASMIGAMVLGLILVSQAGAIHFYKNKADTLEVQFSEFKATTKALGEAAEAKAKLTEKENDDAISDALTLRDDAIKRMQLAQAAARAAGRGLSPGPSAPAGSSEICFSSAAYNAAFQQYRDGLAKRLADLGQLAVEGDQAEIDAQTLIKAWPK